LLSLAKDEQYHQADKKRELHKFQALTQLPWEGLMEVMRDT
jgi:hypothetical protein